MALLGGADVKVICSEGSLATGKDCDATGAASYPEPLNPRALIVHVPAVMKSTVAGDQNGGCGYFSDRAFQF